MEVNDFVEYERDVFLVTCLNDTNFHLIKRLEKKVVSIRSLNPNYISMGIQMMPQYETQFALIRDTRGI